jgi:PAS domain S-box-containing protein
MRFSLGITPARIGFLKPIQNKLVLLILTLLVPMLLLQIYILNDRFQGGRTAELAANLEVARAVAKTFEAFVMDIVHTELAVGQAMIIPTATDQDRGRILDEFRTDNPALTWAIWINPAGIVVASSPGGMTGIDETDRKFYQDIISGKTWSTSDLVIGKMSEKPVFSIARGIRSPQGELLGVVGATIDPERLLDVLKINRTNTGHVSILDTKGMLVHLNPAKKLSWEQRNWLKDYPVIQEALGSSEVVISLISKFSGSPTLAAFVPIPSLGWVAGASREEADALSAIKSSILPQAYFFLLITIAAFGFALLFSGIISSSVRKLRDYALAYGSGDAQDRLPPFGIAELDDLAGAMNEMIEDIEERERERKLAENALRESEGKYRLFVETASEWVWALDAEQNVTFMNQIMCDKLGYHMNEIIGRPVTLLIHQDQLDDLESRMKLRRRGLGETYELKFIQKNGEALWVIVSAKALTGGNGEFKGSFAMGTDITERRRAEEEREKIVELLRLVNESKNMDGLIHAVTNFFKEKSGCEAVGIRLRREHDYPYYETRGFPAQFLRLENKLCVRDDEGKPMLDSSGNPVLECMCGNVICGRFDSSKPFFTPKGSFWTNNTTELLATSTDSDRKARTRNRCNGEGYESVALIALRAGEERLGLLQLNDKRKGLFTPEHIDFWERLADYTAAALAKLRAEDALRESETRFQKLVEGAPEAVFIQTRGCFAYLNKAALMLFGATSADQLLGKSVMERFHPDYRSAIRERIRLVNEVKTSVPSLEEKYVRLDGSTVDVEVSPVPFRYENHDGALVFVRDITERKLAENAKKQLEGQLFQAQKMESVGRLAGGVAHDYNNMLGVIIGRAEMALQQDVSIEVHDDLEEILKAGRRSADLTRQLLAFARRQTAAPKILDLNDMISGMLKMLRRLIGEDIDLSWMPGLDLWKVKIDPSQVDQVLANLAVNARDAISGVGTVIIKTENVVINYPNVAGIAEFIPGDYVLLTVNDTGAGMSKEVSEKIFEPFFTTKELGKGTGLGLSTVYGIVKQNDGFISVASQPGEGAIFKIYLPRCGAESEQTALEDAAPSPPTGKETILLVEDDEAVLNLSRMMLERLGYTVLVAHTPSHAMQLAQDLHGDLDLLITDVVMPEMNGRELVERLRAVRPDLKCLFMSGYTADVIARQGVLDEGVNFIQKPFAKDNFAVRVRQVLDHLE